MLKIENLTKTYGVHKALENLSLHVPKGIVFGLLGPNGAGKTTLIRIINQIIEPDQGTILIEGKPLCPDHIARIGYLPEERGLYKKMSVWDQLVYFARLKGLTQRESKIRINHWLQKFEISSWKDKKIEDLSKGMAQKVQFIATVIHTPSLLILDEPFSGFDPLNAEIIKEEILELKARGTTVVLSTHRMESVELLCDRVAMLHQSKKILDGTIREVKASFKTEVFKVALTQLTQEIPKEWIPRFSDEGCRFSLPLSGKTPNELLAELMQLGQVTQFEEVVPSMEEIFIQQIKSANYD
jgi:ABC-2 type transport system ATP-binding protein